MRLEFKMSFRTICYTATIFWLHHQHEAIVAGLSVDNNTMCVIRSHEPISSTILSSKISTSQWRYNEHDGISNHQPHDCLLNRLFTHRSKKTSKLRVTGLCEGNSPVTDEFPAQRASDVENFSIWWHHHEFYQDAITWNACDMFVHCSLWHMSPK